ncbi:eukaryotic translation initiation factor 3 subunit G-like, partial [Trifolium medium]|nr:eukaryotic translation initiation factor 3 subunit G-like [Trifolium medium]
VSSVKLAPLFVEPDSRLGDFGFVTFVNKEDAERAMEELNASGPRGRDKRTLKLDWVSNLKKST